jgi:two-component system C4-dicarboxylate transport sensor histidine kinase DctB
MAAFAYFKAEEISTAKGRLSLYKSTLESEIERISYFPYVLAQDPYVINGTLGKNLNGLNKRLADFAEKSQLDFIYLLDETGLTIASSNYNQADSFLGKNYGFRPYFKEAMKGEVGEFYGIGITTSLPGFFISAPVRNYGGDIIGVIAIKLNLRRLEQNWAEAGEVVLLTNADGVVLLSSNPDWRYKALHDIPDERRAIIQESRQFQNEPLSLLHWNQRNENQASIQGIRYLLVTATLPSRQWTLSFFASERAIETQAWLTLITLVVIASLMFAVFQIRKTKRIGAALRESQADSEELREANHLLAVEIEERKATEERLKNAQDELARTSRLAALGHVSVSVTHELGQPLAAMKNYLAAAEISGSSANPKLLSQFGGLITRMEAITKQLKFFSRKGSRDFEKVNLQDVLRGAEELLAPNLEKHGITYTNGLPNKPIFVRGNKHRLEQVMTNIMRNAIDAMNGEELRQLHVDIQRTDNHGILRILDTGPGIGQSTIRDLEEPFYTTRASGEGMGLGLAISTEIVKEHGGSIHAENRYDKGAAFHIEIPLIAENSDA